MTLTEYMNQEEPVWRPKVILSEGEFINHGSTKSGNDKFTFIEIPALHEKYGISGNYIQVEDYPELYTMSDQGNIRRLSCFNLK